MLKIGGACKMGNSKLPISLLIAKGNKHLTKLEIEERQNSEVIADAENIFAPAFLRTKKQKDKFNYLAEQLLNAKIIANLDIETLGRYILLQEQYNQIAKLISKTDIISDDYDKLLAKQTKIFSMLDKVANELGLNIMARCKIATPTIKEKPKNKFEKFGAINNG